MPISLYHARRESLAAVMIASLKAYAYLGRLSPARSKANQAEETPIPENPRNPEDFNPLQESCFQNPYAFYQMLRDQHPVYQLSNGVICISRYEDIVTLSRDIETFSSQHQGIVANLKPGQDLLKQVKVFETLADLGLIPADVLATSDQPQHTTERKVGHAGLNSRFVKSLEGKIEALCQSMLDPILAKGEVEFMQEFGWRLPMVLILRLLGLPESDFEQIKDWCVDILASQNGIQSSAEMAQSYASALCFIRYCWRHFLQVKQAPADNLMGILAKAANDQDSEFNDQKAVSAIFQLIVAGSDSSATTMGNALKLLIETPGMQKKLRDDPEQIPAFIEEVFRLEAAFQGHFRWVKKDSELHGVQLKRGDRIFLMWASGNRDERFWDAPEKMILNRKNGKKHLTFGHGIHACIGRELARSEIRIVLKAFLQHSQDLSITGETPFVASMFARTLLQLPISIEAPKKESELGASSMQETA
ncbi:MAG: cytochrome P450 [Pseudomonadales bacterium]|nr:cytochrome P450 [Pseudomonadales bacterium]